MLLASLALALGVLFGAPGTVSPASQLPGTWPGFSADEGVFLVTPTDGGGQAAYFIAQNQRHSISASDLQQEEQLNPLRPVRSAARDEVLGFVEGAPVGSATVGLLQQASPAPVAKPADPAPVQADVAADVTAEDNTYVLRAGDNLTRVAAHYGTTVDAILAANGISNANRIYGGQTLVIPSGEVADTAVAETAPVAETSDTTTAETYTVQPGDSAFLIARRFGIDQQALLDANGISNPNRVYAGQTLEIPSGDV